MTGLAIGRRSENARRLAPYDARVRRPAMVPTLVGLSLRFMPGAHALA
jgi:hypothetical protein